MILSIFGLSHSIAAQMQESFSEESTIIAGSVVLLRERYCLDTAFHLSME